MHVFGSKGWIESRGDTDLIVRGLEGGPTGSRSKRSARRRRSSRPLPTRVAAKTPFLVPPEEAVNGVAVLEAIVASAAKGKPIKIRC